jgi:long-chain acyl-CoA synthetase
VRSSRARARSRCLLYISEVRILPYSYESDTLADIPRRSAAAFGTAPALGMTGTDSPAISYADFDRLTLRAAAMLARAGIGPGDRVAILSENRPEWCIASLGIARAGLVSVPILVDFPLAQVANILEHSGSRAVFASERHRKRLAGASEKLPAILAIEELSAPSPELDAAALAYSPPTVLPSDLAAIVYTSGTTGLSKGVMLQHRNFIADALSCDSVIRLNTDDLVLSILPLAHTYEYTIGFLIPIMSGACIRYLDRPPSASALMPALAALRPTIMLSVPLVIEKTYRSAIKPGLEKMGIYKFKLLRPLLQRAAGRKLYAAFGGRMRFFGIGGAPLDPEVEAFLLRARFPYAIGYGLTETAPIIAASAVGKTSLKVAGLPLGDADIRIAGTDGGAIGEIQVKGPMVGPGYYKDPARTAEAFTVDGYFRTGDLGSFDATGSLSVRGRLKTMILGASGENIYPEEVEAVINSVPEVLESLVYGDEEGLTALVHINPDTLSELLKSGVESAEAAVNSLGKAVGAGIENAEKAATALLERIKKETNSRLAAFSRLAKVELQVEPFEKTPTQKIKRFMYPKNEGK